MVYALSITWSLSSGGLWPQVKGHYLSSWVNAEKLYIVTYTLIESFILGD